MSLSALPWSAVEPGHTIVETDGSAWSVKALGGGVAVDHGGTVRTYRPDGIAIIDITSYSHALAIIFAAFPGTTTIE